MPKNVEIIIKGSFTLEQLEKVMRDVRQYANGKYCDLTTVDQIHYLADQMMVEIKYDRTGELYFGVKSISVFRTVGV